ncbi:radical SAM protein, partial [Escherichia coli]
AKLTMHTRSHLILQDIELLKSFGERLQVGVSITTDNDDVRKEFEPKAPSIQRRLDLIKRLSAEGIKVYASMAPLLPCDPERLLEML